VYFSKALPYFETLPKPFLITFLLTQQVEFSKDLEVRGDKFRDFKNESTI